MNPLKGDQQIPCEECVALLTDYLEGTLTPEKRSALESHLRVCPDCGPYHSNFLKAIELARAAGKDMTERRALPSADALIRSILNARKDVQP